MPLNTQTLTHTYVRRAVKNKQELLTVLAGLILAPVACQGAGTARELAVSIRAALLAVRDGAEVVALAHALAPETPSPLLDFSALLTGTGLPGAQAESAGRALVHYVLGSVTEEQTRAGLARAGLLPPAEGSGRPGGGASDSAAGSNASVGASVWGAESVFLLGLDLFLAGVGTIGARSPASA